MSSNKLCQMQGHTSSIYVTKFMPNTGNEQIITSAADRQVSNYLLNQSWLCLHIVEACTVHAEHALDVLQVRLVNLQRSAVKPYTFHHGRVKALVPLDPCKPAQPPAHCMLCVPISVAYGLYALRLRLARWFPAVMFISGSDDGTVRHYDTREPASTSSIPGMRTGDVLGKTAHQANNQLGLLCTCLLLET